MRFFTQTHLTRFHSTNICYRTNFIQSLRIVLRWGHGFWYPTCSSIYPAHHPRRDFCAWGHERSGTRVLVCGWVAIGGITQPRFRHPSTHTFRIHRVQKTGKLGRCALVCALVAVFMVYSPPFQPVPLPNSWHCNSFVIHIWVVCALLVCRPRTTSGHPACFPGCVLHPDLDMVGHRRAGNLGYCTLHHGQTVGMAVSAKIVGAAQAEKMTDSRFVHKETSRTNSLQHLLL